MKVPMRTVESMNENMFVHKPIAIGFIIVKRPDSNTLNLEKDGYNKYFGKDCV